MASGTLAPIPSSGGDAPAPLPANLNGALAGATSEDSPGTNLVRVLSVLKRFRWLILGMTLAGLGGGIAATRFITPDYQVSATIWIETPSQGRAGTPIQGDELLTSRAWVELLRTFAVLDPVVRERKLYLLAAAEDSTLFRDFDLADRFLPGEYEFSVSTDGTQYQLRQPARLVSEAGAIGDSIGKDLGFRWVLSPSPALRGLATTFEVITPREASIKLASDLQTVLREENFLAVSLKGKNPEAAAGTLNALLARFVDEAAAQKRAKLTMLAQVLDSQVINQAEKLKEAEGALEGFRVNTVTLPREETPIAPGLQFTQPTVYTNYFAIRTELEALRRDRQAIEAIVDRARGGEIAVDAFNTINAVRGAPDLLRVLTELSSASADLRLLLTRYTEEWREVKDLRERIADLQTRIIPQYALALVDQLKIQERDLESRIASTSRELQSIPSRAQTEARLRREMEQAEFLYKTLENSRQQARLAEASAIPDVRILDRAVAPNRPSSNQAWTIILLGFAGGLGLAVGLAILLDRIDKRFRYPTQISGGLGLPILGAIPVIRRPRNGKLSGEESAQVVEAFRSVRMNLVHSFDAPGAMLVTVTSPSPGDGKSLVASNLALSCAEAGYRTLLIDGDIRRGELHRTFGVDRRPGLLDHLGGGHDLSEILRTTSHTNLTVIPCGTRRPQGPELLGTARMRDALERLRSQFEVVIVDSPPLGAGIDPFVLGTLTTNMVLVVRAGSTDRDLAEAKLQVIDRLPIRLLGAILNDVRVGEGAYRYYAYSYGYLAEGEGPLEKVAEPL